ncbi:MAG: formyltransferase family protein [Myxococcota bacterium]
MPLKLAIFGQAPFGRDVTLRLAEAGHEIVGVHVPPDGGGRPDPLAVAADEKGWPLFRYKGYRRKGAAIPERVDEYRALGADLNVMPFTTVLLPPEITDAPKHGSVCFHPSVLPAFRGGAALSWQIFEGATESGISIFQPDEGVDTGPLYLQKAGVPIEPTDTMASLYFDKLYPMGVDGMVEVVDAIAAGTARLTPQVEEGASHQGLVDDDVARIDLGWDLARVEQRIRGCDPSPGAWLSHGETRLRLFGCAVESRSETGDAPGTVRSVGEDGLVIAVRGGSLRIQKVRGAAGKVAAADSGLSAGDVLA